MSWFKRKPNPAATVRQPHAYPLASDDSIAMPFVCSTCGRTDLPETGGWDPPICMECDASINEDAILEEMDHEGSSDNW
jgi:hypothetical protein